MRMPIMQAMSRFIRKYKEQQIRIIDTAALICTALWADGEFFKEILKDLKNA